MDGTCTAKCWTSVVCATCHLRKSPYGRSVPMEAANSYCDHECPGYEKEPRAPHLWSVHDDSRHYTDPEGWAEHVAGCEQCRGDATDGAGGRVKGGGM